MKHGSHQVPFRAPPPPRQSQAVCIHCHVAWWLRLYLQSVAMVATLTGLEPDMDKVGCWIDRGIKLRVVPFQVAM